MGVVVLKICISPSAPLLQDSWELQLLIFLGKSLSLSLPASLGAQPQDPKLRTSLLLRAGALKGQKLPHQRAFVGPGGWGNGGQGEELSGKAKAWRQASWAWARWQGQSPPPVSVAVGPGAGEGGKALTSTGLALLQVLVIARTLGRGHQEVICVLGVRGGVGKGGGARGGSADPTATSRGVGRRRGRGPGLRHVPWSMPQLSDHLVGNQGLSFPWCEGRLHSASPAPAPHPSRGSTSQWQVQTLGRWTPDPGPQSWSKGTQRHQEAGHRGPWRRARAEKGSRTWGFSWLQPHRPITLISLPTPFQEPGNQAAHNN